MPIAAVWPEIVLLLVAISIVLGAAFLPHARQWLAAPVAVTATAVAATGIALQLDQARWAFSGVWAVDGAAAAAKLMIVVVTGACAALAPHWLARDRRHGEYYAILLLSALGAMMMAGAADTLQLTIGILLASVTGYTLAAYHRGWALSVEAGMKYFLIGAMANALLLVGLVLLFGRFATTDYGAMRAALPAGVAPDLLVATGLVVTGLAFKLGAVPAHAWVPDVAQGAPAPAAAFLTVVPKIGAAVALARLLHTLAGPALDWQPVIAVLAVATMTLGNLAALWQRDVRRLLGWSSVSQAGYLLMAVVVLRATPHALAALLVFLAGYAAANLAAFAVVTELRGRTALEHFRGLATARPAAAAVLALSLLSLAGIPPLAGFFGKLALFRAAIDGGYAWLAVVGVVNTVVSLAYYLRVLGPVYFATAPHPIATLGVWSRWTMLGGGAAVLTLGLGAQALFRTAQGLVMLP